MNVISLIFIENNKHLTTEIAYQKEIMLIMSFTA